MRDKLMLIILAAAAVALLLVWFLIDAPVATPVGTNAETELSSAPAEQQIDDANLHDSKVTVQTSDRAFNDGSQTGNSPATDQVESNDTVATDFERNYVVGKFVAPEQLQIAVYRAVNDELDGYDAYVNNMECNSGDCDIDIRIVAPTNVSAKGADLYARINEQLADNRLTRSIMVGIRSMRIDENRDGRLELVTMPASTSDEIARARAEFEQRMLEQSPDN